MGSGDVEEFIEKLINLGFSYITNDKHNEIAVVDQYAGLFSPCSWLETSITTFPRPEIKVSTCWLKGSADREVGIRLSKDYDPAQFEETKFIE